MSELFNELCYFVACLVGFLLLGGGGLFVCLLLLLLFFGRAVQGVSILFVSKFLFQAL